MAFQFQGEQICSRCGNKYQWVTTQLEKNEVITGFMDQMWRNVKNCNRISHTDPYSIELSCPECGGREFVEKER